jgi:DNA-binding MarR family transcriptional regulator
MAKMKRSEARIIVYLNNVDSTLKYGSSMAIKLRMDYAYLLMILRGLKDRGWIKAIPKLGKVFYELTDQSPLAEAKELLISNP